MPTGSKTSLSLFSVLIACAAMGAVATTQAQRRPTSPQMRGDGPPPAAKPFSITKADPSLDDVISSDARLIELAHGFGLTEAGLWVPEGGDGYWVFAGMLDN